MNVLVAVTVTLQLAAGECRLDQAIITYVPPNTSHVVTVSDCGALRCWERYLETNGQRVGQARVCSSESNHGDRFEAVPPTTKERLP